MIDNNDDMICFKVTFFQFFPKDLFIDPDLKTKKMEMKMERNETTNIEGLN